MGEAFLPLDRMEEVTQARLLSITCGGRWPGSMLGSAMTAAPRPTVTALDAAMARFASGDDAALGEVYDQASPAIFTFLLRLGRDRSLAEDLTQETFLRIHRARGLYRQGAPVMPWAYTIARRLFLDEVRGRRHAAARDASAPTASESVTGEASLAAGVDWGAHAQQRSAEELLADVQLASAVNDALDRLPEAQASAFRLLKGEGLSVSEAAAVMGTTSGAVKLRAHRAYQSLRHMLAGQFVSSSAAKSASQKQQRGPGRNVNDADGGAR